MNRTKNIFYSYPFIKPTQTAMRNDASLISFKSQIQHFLYFWYRAIILERRKIQLNTIITTVDHL